MRERETKTERQQKRERERQTDRETEIETQRQRDREMECIYKSKVYKKKNVYRKMKLHQNSDWPMTTANEQQQKSGCMENTQKNILPSQ